LSYSVSRTFCYVRTVDTKNVAVCCLLSARIIEKLTLAGSNDAPACFLRAQTIDDLERSTHGLREICTIVLRITICARFLKSMGKLIFIMYYYLISNVVASSAVSGAVVYDVFDSC
jgi:hypothetical protein